MAARTESGSVTSSSNRSATSRSSRSFGLRAVAITSWPRFAHSSTVARPMARAAPVTRIRIAAPSARRGEQHGQRIRPTERVALDDRIARAVGIEAQARQPVEDTTEADAELEAREVHAEALVRTGAEREVVLDGTTELPLVRVVKTRRVVVRRRGDHADRRTGRDRAT